MTRSRLLTIAQDVARKSIALKDTSSFLHNSEALLDELDDVCSALAHEAANVAHALHGKTAVYSVCIEDVARTMPDMV